MITVSQEVYQTIVTVQEKKKATTQKLQNTLLLIDIKQNAEKKSKFVIQKLKEIPPKTPVYNSSGRMFVSTSIEQVIDTKERKVARITEELKTLKKSKDFLEKQISDAEKQLKEIVDQAKK
ncbi:prefoldin subunit 1 [Anaeramoeba ignava]|uniref:Prefoldin subunit 1 n=1 Tax=Anaeramoeba ignava TaxID=1746090 RepID=A0A9Q0LWM5_ANAIG|nr:prefoldin subunit 1 [Anaeramoeba ignava]|eukprot:Anaeramoba_ignava/a234408_67.p1 GENE.a234408_67~~a234408_67.p1  ORF type:complete len:121 (+),score=55.10 a234408_67:30-392(+)